MNSQHRGTRCLYWFGPPLWFNTLLQCGGGGLPLGLMMNSTREEQPPEVEVFLWLGSRSGWMRLRSHLSSTMVARPIYRGPGPLPKYRAGREPTTAGKFGGGQLVQAILTKRSSPAKSSGGDAILGSTMTSVLPSSWSWSRCTDIATFARCLGTPLPRLLP